MQGELAERIAHFKVPSVIRFVVDPLPRNAMGKLMKAELAPLVATEACV